MQERGDPLRLVDQDGPDLRTGGNRFKVQPLRLRNAVPENRRTGKVDGKVGVETSQEGGFPYLSGVEKQHAPSCLQQPGEDGAFIHVGIIAALLPTGKYQIKPSHSKEDRRSVGIDVLVRARSNGIRLRYTPKACDPLSN